MGLSPKLVEDILAVLQRLRAEGLSLLLVEQNAKLTFEATSSCLVVENGEVAMTGTSAELQPRPAGAADLPRAVTAPPPAAAGRPVAAAGQASGPYSPLPGASGSVLVKYCRVAAEISSRVR